MNFRDRIQSAHTKLLAVPHEPAQTASAAAGWSRKEILGHLIDSALNNHQRFVRAALDGSYSGPTYRQNEWVRIHGYESHEWSELLDHWHGQNQLLSAVVQRIPPERLSAECTIGENGPVSLEFLISDYLEHLEHHVRQITGT